MTAHSLFKDPFQAADDNACKGREDKAHYIFDFAARSMDRDVWAVRDAKNRQLANGFLLHLQYLRTGTKAMGLSREVLGLRQGAEGTVSPWGAEEQMESVPDKRRAATLATADAFQLFCFIARSEESRTPETQQPRYALVKPILLPVSETPGS